MVSYSRFWTNLRKWGASMIRTPRSSKQHVNGLHKTVQIINMREYIGGGNDGSPAMTSHDLRRHLGLIKSLIVSIPRLMAISAILADGSIPRIRHPFVFESVEKHPYIATDINRQASRSEFESIHDRGSKIKEVSASGQCRGRLVRIIMLIQDIGWNRITEL